MPLDYGGGPSPRIVSGQGRGFLGGKIPLKMCGLQLVLMSLLGRQLFL